SRKYLTERRDTFDVFINGRGWIDGEYNQDPYGGKAKGFAGMTRMEVWNEDIKKRADEFRRPASEHTLDLLLKRMSRAQKIKRNGVFITMCGDKLWYYGDEALMHLNEWVYVRYDPSDPREVRLYDMDTDKYLWTWKLADELMMDYINASIKDFEDLGKRNSAIRKAILAVKNGIINSVDPDKRIDELAIAVERLVQKSKDSGGIVQPSTYIPVFAEEEIEEHPNLRDITAVTSFVELLSASAIANRKDG
ncbi:MAG: Mu transposase C-terminal domain-containing protein, partial [Oscillospiraceae bacterium]